MPDVTVAPSHLDSRIARQEAVDRAWVPRRIAGFFAGIAIAIAGAALGVEGAGILVGLALFVGIVTWHQRLRGRLARWRLYRDIVRAEHARANLEWANLPLLPAVPKAPPHFADLDIIGPSSLLRRLNATVSNLGFRRLVELFEDHGVTAADVRERQALVRELAPLRRFRRRFQFVARDAARDAGDAAALEDALGSPFHSPQAPLYTALLALAQAFSLVGLVGYVAFRQPPWFLVGWAASFAAYGFGTRHFFDAFGRAQKAEVALRRFVGIARFLEASRFPRGNRLMALFAPFHADDRPSRLLSRLSIPVSFLSVQANPYVAIFLNFFFPWAFAFALVAEKIRRDIAAHLPVWLESIARAEAFLCLAELAAEGSATTWPEPLENDDPTFLDAEQLGHPLIPKARRVTNPLRLDANTPCVLLTGSNMSGKSTFLRSAGVNLLLAKAGAPAIASRFRFRLLDVYTSLRIADSIEDQTSSFYAEVKRLAVILEHAKAGRALYLIDEIFRGTNNRERLVGSRAYLKAVVGTASVGIVSTHDLELAELGHQDARIANFHFKESFENERMTFHYRIASGPCPTTNALQIMRLAGLPIAP